MSSTRTRREFVRDLGLSAAALPFVLNLPSLGFAQGTRRRQRLVVIFSPNGSNPELIPNEDSQDFEIEDTNLVSRNRFTGLDRVESGHRAYYGLHLSANGASGFSDAFIGQSYRLRRDTSFAAASGLRR